MSVRSDIDEQSAIKEENRNREENTEMGGAKSRRRTKIEGRRKKRETEEEAEIREEGLY